MVQFSPGQCTSVCVCECSLEGVEGGRAGREADRRPAVGAHVHQGAARHRQVASPSERLKVELERGC